MCVCVFVCFRNFCLEIAEKLFGSDREAELVGTDAGRRVSEKPAGLVHRQLVGCTPAEADVRGGPAARGREPEVAITEPSDTEEPRQTVAVPVLRRAIKVGQYRPVDASGATSRTYNGAHARAGGRRSYIISLTYRQCCI